MVFGWEIRGKGAAGKAGRHDGTVHWMTSNEGHKERAPSLHSGLSVGRVVARAEHGLGEEHELEAGQWLGRIGTECRSTQVVQQPLPKASR